MAAAASDDPDRFYGVGDGPIVEVRVKGSRFVGRAFTAADEPAAESTLAGLRKLEYDATHHCWALRLPPLGRAFERCDDDGEPSGTAGRPILDLLSGRDLYFTLIVVTRWFGGTKLGPGGLARAYAETAAASLAAAPIREIWRLRTLFVDIDWEGLGVVESELARTADLWHSVRRDFLERPHLRVTVPAGRADTLRQALIEATGARAVIRVEDASLL